MRVMARRMCVVVGEGGYGEGDRSGKGGGGHTSPVVIENLTFPVNIFFLLDGIQMRINVESTRSVVSRARLKV